MTTVPEESTRERGRFAPRDRVTVTISGRAFPGRIVSKVNDVDAYTVALTGRRITVQGRELAPKTDNNNSTKGE